MNLSDLLSKFPALWVVIGGVLVGAIAFFIARKAVALSGAAQDKLITILQESVKTLEQERNQYREQSHTYRNECQAKELLLKEADSRPDLTRLFESQQKEADRRYEVYTAQTELIARQTEVLGGMAENQRKLVQDFETHEKNNAERQTVMNGLLHTLVAETKRKTRRKI